jgi:hypothetical protein
MRYADLHRRSIEDPNGFWLEQAQAIDWVAPPQKALFPTARRSTSGSRTPRSMPAGTRSTAMSKAGAPSRRR